MRDNDTHAGYIPSLTFEARSKTPTTGFVTALLGNGSQAIVMVVVRQIDHEPHQSFPNPFEESDGAACFCTFDRFHLHNHSVSLCHLIAIRTHDNTLETTCDTRGESLRSRSHPVSFATQLGSGTMKGATPTWRVSAYSSSGSCVACFGILRPKWQLKDLCRHYS